MKNSNLIMLALMLLVITTILIGCNEDEGVHAKQSPQDEDEIIESNMEQDISEYIIEIESLQSYTDFLNEENQYLVNTIKQVLENFSDDEMLEFSQSQFTYDLQVNGESIPENGEIVITSGDVEILVMESSRGHEFLQPEWFEKGKISGNYIEHILDFDSTAWTPTGMDGTVNTAQGYNITNAKAGDYFSFHITDELKDRLKIDTNLIQIEIN